MILVSVLPTMLQQKFEERCSYNGLDGQSGHLRYATDMNIT